MDKPEKIDVRVTVSDGIKCPRCWNYHHVQYNYEGLCDRCCSVILEDFPEHESVEGIKKAYEMQKLHFTKQGEEK